MVTELGKKFFIGEEAELRQVMMANCKKVVLLCDSTKFDQNSLFRIGYFNRIHAVITDRKPSSQWVDFLKEKGFELFY